MGRLPILRRGKQQIVTTTRTARMIVAMMEISFAKHKTGC